MTQEKQFCRNCGKRDEQALKGFWEPGLCADCHRLPIIGIRYDVFTGRRIEPLPAEDQACPEKSPTKLDHQRGKMRVLADDISYLMMRIEHGSLASIAEHYEVQEEIHDLQRILADWDSYIGMEIAKKAAQHAVNNWVSQISLRVGRSKNEQ